MCILQTVQFSCGCFETKIVNLPVCGESIADDDHPLVPSSDISPDPCGCQVTGHSFWAADNDGAVPAAACDNYQSITSHPRKRARRSVEPETRLQRIEKLRGDRMQGERLAAVRKEMFFPLLVEAQVAHDRYLARLDLNRARVQVWAEKVAAAAADAESPGAAGLLSDEQARGGEVAARKRQAPKTEAEECYEQLRIRAAEELEEGEVPEDGNLLAYLETEEFFLRLAGHWAA